MARENLVNNEWSLQINDAFLILKCLQDGGEIKDYSPATQEHVTGTVYCIAQDRTFTPCPREALDALESARLVEPSRASPTMWGQRELTAEQWEQSHEWAIERYSMTEIGAKLYDLYKDILNETKDCYLTVRLRGPS